jgi:GNAT superfamily N-acetyltransferase
MEWRGGHPDGAAQLTPEFPQAFRHRSGLYPWGGDGMSGQGARVWKGVGMDAPEFSVARIGETPDDERNLRLLHGGISVKNAGWRDTYSEWLSAEELDRIDANLEQTVGNWFAALKEARLGPVWVAIVSDDAGQGKERVVGIASSSPVEQNRRSGFPGGAEGLDVDRDFMIYIDAAWRGRGVAAALAETAIGDASAYLWVLEDNTRAQAFYTKLGFQPDGAVENLPPGWNGAREIRMVRR